MPKDKKSPENKELSYREQMFIHEYLKDLNATAAAIRAGYASKTAHGRAYTWVGDDESRCEEHKRHLWHALQKAKRERLDAVKIDATYVLNRHLEIDRMDILDILNDDGTMKRISDWPKCWRTSINALDVAELAGAKDSDDLSAIVKKIKWPDKVKNLELIGKHVTVQAYREQVKHEGEIVVYDSDYGQRDQD